MLVELVQVEDLQVPKAAEKRNLKDLKVPKATEKKNLMQLKSSHYNMVKKLGENLSKVELSMDNFHDYVVNLLKVGDTIPEAKTVREIFKSIGKQNYWDILDVSFLENIVKEFSKEYEEENMKIIRKYQDELAGYKVAINITDYFKSDQGNDSISIQEEKEKYDERYRSKLSVKLFGDDKAQINISLQSLLYVEKLWKSLCYEFKMPSLPKVLDSIVEGSVIIHWLVSHEHARKILEKVRDAVDFFRREYISGVRLEEVCIYDSDGEGVAEKKVIFFKFL